jgi:hypothetical protein
MRQTFIALQGIAMVIVYQYQYSSMVIWRDLIFQLLEQKRYCNCRHYHRSVVK